MSLAAVGAFLGGVGSLASGLGLGGGGFSRKEYRDQIKIQNQEMRNNLPLNIDAFKKSGIHPLVGLGVQPNSATPTYSSGVDLASMGQGVARAAAAFQSKEEREKQRVQDALTIERMQLENDLLRAQTTQVHRATNPPLPTDPSLLAIDGQAQSHAFEAGISPDVGLARSQSGLAAVVPSEAVKQRIEDMWLPELQWYIRQVQSEPPKGYGYDPFTSEYFPANERSIRAAFKSWKDRSRFSPWRKY